MNPGKTGPPYFFPTYLDPPFIKVRGTLGGMAFKASYDPMIFEGSLIFVLALMHADIRPATANHWTGH